MAGGPRAWKLAAMGESASTACRSAAGPGAALAVLALGLLAAPWAGAATIYRCEGPAGDLAYTSERKAGYQCRAMALDVPTPRTRQAPAAVAGGQGGSGAAAAGASRPSVSFRTAEGASAPSLPSTGNARVTRGAVYRYERDGVTHYTNVRPAAGAGAQVLFSYIEACYACTARPGVDFSRVGLNLTAFSDEVRAAASEHGVDEALVRAVIHAESAFNPNAISHKGAQGLMQLIPATAERFGVSDPFEPAQNIRGGVTYLAWLLRRFDGNVTLASAAYNAGEGAVDRFNGVPPYQETQLYVERVAILADRYRSALVN